MSGGGSGAERSEKATPQRIKKARKEGQIGHSHEIGQWSTVLAASIVVPGVVKGLLNAVSTAMVSAGPVIAKPDIAPALKLLRRTALDGATSLIPLVVLVIAIAVASSAGQGGIRPAPKLLLPKFSRINPLSGFKRMFGAQGAWSLIKSLVKTVVLGLVTYLSVKSMVPTLMSAGALPLNEVLSTTGKAGINLMRTTAVAGLLLSVADVMTVRRRNNKHLKMTKQEVKEEYKQSEGDPHQKGMLRSRAIAIARNRMMADLPEADVVLVNPTHVAVALKYQPDKGAPRVIAKGADHIAARIREKATEHRIPMVENVALARSLYATCEIGQEIPEDMYHAVATVLAFIMRLRRKGSAAGMHRLPGAA